MNPVQSLISQLFLVFFGFVILTFKKGSRAGRALVYLGTILTIITLTFLINIPVIAYSSHENIYVPITYLMGATVTLTICLKAFNKINFKKMFILLAIETAVISTVILILTYIL